MALAPDLLDHLRASTRSCHAQLDESIGLATAEDYRRFLQGSLAALELLEPLIAGSERVPALRADLAELDAGSLAPIAAPSLTSTSAVFGAAYVIEGSTLGGMVMADGVERLGITATRYLRLRGTETGRRWKAFLDTLRGSGSDRDACCDAAVATFAHYTAAFRAADVIA